MKSIIKNEILYSGYIAIKDNKGNEITYKELLFRAEKLLQYMDERSFIFVLCDHHIDMVEFIYEILYLNFVPLLLPNDIDKELLLHLVDIYHPQYIYCSKKHEINKIYDDKIEINNFILIKTGARKIEIHPDIAVLLSTSGTTGSPKLVKLSYDNLYKSSEQVCLRMNIQPGQKGITHLSMSYVYGFTFCLWHWHSGATVLVTEDSILSNRFNDFYKREKANNFAGTPYTYQMLRRIGFWESEKLEYLQWAMSAGTQMSSSDQKSIISILKDKFWIMYGQTECTCFISGMNFDENNIKVKSVGKLLENIKAEIDSETKELILKGETVSMGYAENLNQLSYGDTNYGVLHTGDMAYIDDDGCIYLQGRLSRYIKILGKRISLDDVENYLTNKMKNIEFACIGKDEHISVFSTELNKNIIEEITIMLDQNMKIPRKFISCLFLKEIPRNSAGKVMYAKLKELNDEGKNLKDL